MRSRGGAGSIIHGMRKHRFVHAVLLVAALLFSHWAVAMHACGVAVTVVSAGAPGSHDPCCPDPVAAHACEQHCAFGQSAVDHAKPFAPLDVTLGPALALRVPESGSLRSRIDRPVAAPDPPPSIRSSVLRI